MGLIPILRRKADTAYWRLRYWWFDTESGAHARALALVVSCLVVVVQTARFVTAPHDAASAQHAVIWWVVYLIVALVAAAAVYTMRPKVEQRAPQTANPPSTQDGQAVVDILGTSWIDDYFVLAWKPNGVEKIKAKGKK